MKSVGRLFVSIVLVNPVLWFMRVLDRLRRFIPWFGAVGIERCSSIAEVSGSSRRSKIVAVQYDGDGAWVDIWFASGLRLRFESAELEQAPAGFDPVAELKADHRSFVENKRKGKKRYGG